MRFGDDDAPKMQTWVASALVNKGVVQEKLGDYAVALQLTTEARWRQRRAEGTGEGGAGIELQGPRPNGDWSGG